MLRGSASRRRLCWLWSQTTRRDANTTAEYARFSACCVSTEVIRRLNYWERLRPRWG